MASLALYAGAGAYLVILGRKRTMEDVWSSLAEEVPEISWYEISHFNQAQQSEYVDLRALKERAAQGTEAYQAAKAAVLAELNGATDATLGEAFAGYAPVLDAVAALLTPPANHQAISNDFQGSGGSSTRLKVLSRILNALLLREQEKVRPLAEEFGGDLLAAHSPVEQLDWLAAELLGAASPKLGWCPDPKRSEYARRVAQFLLDHPFRDGGGWASPVFSSYSALMRMGTAEPALVAPIASSSGLFFEFAAASAAVEPLVVDEAQFSALHASLMAGQWISSTSVVSVRSDDPMGGQTLPESATAQLVLLQADQKTTLDATVVVDQPGRLKLVSPLSNLDVEFSGSIVVTSRSTSIDLGPDVFLRARTIELAGGSLQVSKDTSSSDSTGPTVELEATESFVTQASLIGHVTISDLSIIVPQSQRLVYPWIDFRAEPERDGTDGSDDRARRLLNKLMSLARRHGHAGERAVFRKKLEGRQGLGAQDFQRAIATLVQLGVLREEGDMLFLNDSWDQHRYDGKGRQGMVSFDDKRAVWGPVVQVVSAAIRPIEHRGPT